MAWQIAITLAAIGAVILVHGMAATARPATEAAAAPAGEVAAPRAVTPERDPWARVLVAAAVAAALLALGVVLVPAVSGNDEAASTTPPPTTTPPTTTPATTTPPTTTTPTTTSVPSTSTRSTTSTSTSTPTATTTSGGPTTTPPTSPPPGSVLLARALVRSDGSTARVVNRLDEPFVVRRRAVGEYRITFPGLSETARRRSAVSVTTDPSTSPVAGWATNGSLVVLLFDTKTGEPVARAFTFGVSVPDLPGTT